jgi:LysR family glycine cleavage system transcriptional activator
LRDYYSLHISSNGDRNLRQVMFTSPETLGYSDMRINQIAIVQALAKLPSLRRSAKRFKSQCDMSRTHILRRQTWRVPPLAMLRAFESGARHRSLSRAAAELSVTPGAVSRQVSALEKYLGMALIVRQTRGIALTEAGTRLFQGLHSGFERIRATLEELQQPRTERKVTITTLPSLASRWLLPRLSALHQSHPDIAVHVKTSIELEDLSRPEIDFAIRYGAGKWADVASEVLMKVNAYPVCSPGLRKLFGFAKNEPKQLLKAPLIHTVSRQWWIDWFVAAGLEVFELPGGVVVDEFSVAIQFAVDGHGIALGRDPLVEAELAARRLVKLSALTSMSHSAYYICRDPARLPSGHALQVMSWLRDWRPSHLSE